MTKISLIAVTLFFGLSLLAGCNNNSGTPKPTAEKENKPVKTETAEYFSLRPEVEKSYGYTHAVKIGNDIKISGAVSMDDKGNPTAKGDLAQ